MIKFQNFPLPVSARKNISFCCVVLPRDDSTAAGRLDGLERYKSLYPHTRPLREAHIAEVLRIRKIWGEVRYFVKQDGRHLTKDR